MQVTYPECKGWHWNAHLGQTVDDCRLTYNMHVCSELSHTTVSQNSGQLFMPHKMEYIHEQLPTQGEVRSIHYTVILVRAWPFKRWNSGSNEVNIDVLLACLELVMTIHIHIFIPNTTTLVNPICWYDLRRWICAQIQPNQACIHMNYEFVQKLCIYV